MTSFPRKTTESGREIILYCVERGQTCVLTTNCLVTSASYSAEEIAESAVTAVVLLATGFRALLAHSQMFRNFVFSAFAIRIADLLHLVEEVAFNRIDMRLAAWLNKIMATTASARLIGRSPLSCALPARWSVHS